MKTTIKWMCIVFCLFASALLLYGISTCGWFAWWMIPIGIVCAGYMIGFLAIGIRKVRRGEW